MNFSRMLHGYILSTIIIFVAIFGFHPVSSDDCSPSSGSLNCECTITSVECSGFQTNDSEVQNSLITVNFSQMETVILKIIDLKFLPDFRFENTSIRHLTLGYGLQISSSNFFAGSSSLVSLNLQNNSIGDIDDDLFSSLTSLKELYLDVNNLQDLTSSMFTNLRKLNYLSLARNDIHEIKPDVFQNLPVFETLLLNYNNISSMENLNMISSSLTELQITHCLIEGSLEKDTFANMSNLHHLDMSYNRLSEVKPQSLSSLKNLRLLNISYNTIQLLHENAFSEMNNLTELDLRGNGISVVKLTSFANLQNVKFLDLSENNLNGIPCEYTTDFRSLEKIYLHNNKIKMFTQGAFFYSPNLEVMDISGNNLECSCPLTDTFHYLIQNSTMKKEDLENISCFLPSTISFTPIMSYTSSKCIPHDPCKIPDYGNTENPDEEDYDYSGDSTTAQTVTSGEMSTTVTGTASSTERETTLLTMDDDTIANNTTPMLVPAVSDTESTADSFTSTTITSNITSEHTASTSVTESMTQTTVSSSTTGISTNIPTTQKLSTEDTSILTGNTNATNIPTTTPVATISDADNKAETTVNVTATSITTSSVITESSCSSLDLPLQNSSSDSVFTALSNFSYDDKLFCLKWTIVGNLNTVKRCAIKYSYWVGTKSKIVKCPSTVNEVQTWSFGEKIFKYCLDIYAPKKKSFCKDNLYGNTTTSVTYITTSVTSLSQESTEAVGRSEANNYTTVSPSERYDSTAMEENLTTVITSLVEYTSDHVVVSLPTDPTSTISVGTTSSETTYPNKDTDVVTLEPGSNSTRFAITALNVYFNKSNLAFATWAVNRAVLSHACNMTLYVSTQDSDYVEGVYPCKNNTHRMRNVKETEIFKICIVSYHETSGKLTECTLSASPALEQKREKDENDSFNSSLIPLICLLILVVIIVVFIIFKNVFKKTQESSKYEVRAEEVKYQQRVNIRPRSSNDQNIRFSYITKENGDNA